MSLILAAVLMALLQAPPPENPPTATPAAPPAATTDLEPAPATQPPPVPIPPPVAVPSPPVAPAASPPRVSGTIPPSAPTSSYPRAPATPPAAYSRPYTPSPIPPGFNTGPGPAPTLDRPIGPGFPTDDEAAYERSVRNNALAAQGGRGPLDGGWLVSGADGTQLYALQLVDEGLGTLDGAWRTAGNGPATRSGFFAFASRTPGTVSLRFVEKPGAPLTTLTLKADAFGRAWSGELERAGETRPVVMRSR